MPEDIVPDSMEMGSLDHIFFITLTVAIDYQRNANKIWEAARLSFIDPETRYLFKPTELLGRPVHQIQADMQKYSLSKKQKKDA